MVQLKKLCCYNEDYYESINEKQLLKIFVDNLMYNLIKDTLFIT